MIVADTDVLIDALRGRSDAAERIDRELQTGALATTDVTAFELLSGARAGRARDAVERLLEALTIFPLDDAAAREASRARRTLEERGAPIGMADYLIAGVCMVRSATLLTRNRAHFERIPGLLLAEPSPEG